MNMKLSNIIKQIMNEVGESNIKPFKWTGPKTTVTSELEEDMYTFDVPNPDADGADIKYQVEVPFDKNRTTCDISFRPSKVELGQDPHILNVNSGHIFRIMATIIDIVNDVIKKNKNLKQIEMSPTKSNADDDRRFKLYMAYIKKNMPIGWKIARTNTHWTGDRIVLRANTA